MENKFLYEKIAHTSPLQFKCFIASLEHSCPHWHEEYEIIILLKGRICVRNNGRKFKMCTDDILLVNSREIHSIFECSEGNICLFLQFNPNIFMNIDSEENKKLNFYLNTCDQTIKSMISPNHFIKIIATIWLLSYEKKPGYKFHMRSKFYQLIGDLLAYTIYDECYTCYNQISENEIITLNKLINFIQKNFREDINQEDICRYLGMSRSTLYRFTNNTLGMSANSLINYYRIDEAKKLLKNTDYPISHITTLCGYSNDTTFYRAFKKETNKTPNEFRKGGINVNSSDGRIQGYMPYDYREVYIIIQKYITEF